MKWNFLKSIVDGILDAVAPRHCLGNGSCLSKNDRFEKSLLSNTFLDSLEIAPDSDEIILHCQDILGKDNVRIKQFHALYLFENDSPIQEVIHYFKYKHYQMLGTSLGTLLGEMLKKQYKRLPEVIIPIPLHPVRIRERGFNQADIIAKAVGNVLQRPVLTQNVLRTIYRKPQALQEFSNRIKFDEGMFSVRNSESIEKKHVLLIDDVLTTSSTVNAVARTLLYAGAKRVDTAVLCYTKPKKY